MLDIILAAAIIGGDGCVMVKKTTPKGHVLNKRKHYKVVKKKTGWEEWEIECGPVATLPPMDVDTPEVVPDIPFQGMPYEVPTPTVEQPSGPLQPTPMEREAYQTYPSFGGSYSYSGGGSVGYNASYAFVEGCAECCYPTTPAVPEPATWLLILGGIAAICNIARQKGKSVV